MSLLVVSNTSGGSLAGGASLTLDENACNYALGVGFAIGSRVQRRQVVTSPYVAWRTLVGTVDDGGALTVPAIVTADDTDQLRARLGFLIAYFLQRQFTLTYTHTAKSKITGLAGATQYAWACEPADYSVGEGGEFIYGAWERQLGQPVVFSVPHGPPILGPL